jgi:isoamylase
MTETRTTLRRGSCYPLGATLDEDGVNFSLFSKNATQVELCLFDRVDDYRPARAITLRPNRNRTFYYWHVFVPGLRAGQIYAYRVEGPYNPKNGHRFVGDKLLLDPYGKAVVVPRHYSRIGARQPGDNTAAAMKNVVADMAAYDWQGDSPLNRPYTNTLIYELHVRGFTRHPNSGVAPDKRGTFAGLIEKIPYLKALGVTAVELLPVFQFDSQDVHEGLVNYWGYSPVSFFAPHSAYSSRKDPLGPLDEFRDMVKALHRVGIEVILDVVYNHTAEGDQDGPTFSFKGLENEIYYILDQQDHSRYANFSGTGNTLNASNTIVRRLILDSLYFWVEEMHVDGFRFDLASALSRGVQGQPWETPPTLWDIESDPRLAGTKLIAEAWDAGGLYQVGTFIGDRWNEWNGKFRDDIRAFVKGDRGMVPRLPARLLASPDLYGHEDREPEQSINFVTCHDGFTLNDLVSYNHKHNEANGEHNHDGHNENFSWNHGYEGPTDDPKIESLRNRQVKNFLAITLLSLGTPMLLMGDEVRRTQQGNNNAYCQDNPISWFDWSLVDKHADILRFVQRLIRVRLNLDVLRGDSNTSLTSFLQEAKIHWHGITLNNPDWSNGSHSLAMTMQCLRGTCAFHFMLNMYWDSLTFELPRPAGGSSVRWRRVLDTYLPSPDDICEPASAPAVNAIDYRVGPRSVVVLVSQAKRGHRAGDR